MSASNRLSPAELAAGIGVVARRELGAYFDSSIAYVYTIAFAVLSNSIFMNEFFLAGTVDMSGFFDLMPLLLPVFLPAVTMRLWAEERRQRTIELLLTLPITPAQAVLGKFLAALGLFGLFLAGSAPIAVMLGMLGHPDWGRIASGYLGLAVLGASFLALGMFLSALSGDQIVAFVASSTACFLLVLCGQERVVSVVDGLFPSLALGTLARDTLSVLPHYEAFVAGRIELAAVLFFAGACAALLWLCAVVLEKVRA